MLPVNSSLAAMFNPAGYTTDEVQFEQVENDEQKKQAGLLIREYLEWLNGRTQSRYGMEFDVEGMVKSDLSDTHKFHPPDGLFYLVRYQNQVAGVGRLKKLAAGAAEVQRMYVPPTYRGRGIGRAIINGLIEDARSLGYRELRLESLKFLDAAHALYHSLGFHDIDPYVDNSMKAYQSAAQLDKYHSITVFMGLDL
jgi:GNAT superfamily N-acetyltransferase